MVGLAAATLGDVERARGEKYERLIGRAKEIPAIKTVVVHPCDETSLEGATDAAEADIILPVLVGPQARCCGGTFTGTIENAGLRLSYIIVKEAKRLGADMIATACPLCQFNLECYQGSMEKSYDDELNIPSLYFSQLLGYAMGIEPKKLSMHNMLVSPDEALAACGA